MAKDAVVSLIGTIREKANRFIEKELDKNGLKGLVGSHGSILAELYFSKDDIKVTEIAKRIKRSKSTTTELVNKLEKFGYVEKIQSIEDRRNTYVVLTEKGKSTKNAFMKISDKLIQTIYKDIPAYEQEMLVAVLEKVEANMEKDGR